MKQLIFILFSMILCSCSQKETNQEQSNDSKIAHDEYAKLCLEKLEKKISVCSKTWGLGSFEQWMVDQKKGQLIFSNPSSNEQVICSLQFIGSTSLTSGTWLWAWENSSILESLTIYAQKTLAYGKKTGVEKLTTAKWAATEEDAWEMTAIACELNKATGAYQGLYDGGSVFLAFDNVRIKPTSPPQSIP